MTKQLRPLIFKDKFFEHTEKKINELLLEKIYGPIYEILKKYLDIKINASNKILERILSHKLQYVNGAFTGDINATTSRELQKLGATFDKRSKQWKLPVNKVPEDMKIAFSSAKSSIAKMNQELLKFMDEIKKRNPLKDSNFEGEFIKSIHMIDHDWRGTAKQLEVTPDMSEEAKENIASEYSTNLSLDIVDWSDENILKLREQVEENAAQGFRANNLVDIIKKNQGVSLSKAKFLARQETSLLMSKQREERYKSAGVKRYRWKTVKDARAREDHLDLDNEIFSWDSPPVVDQKTGRTGHPGEDFNCRCIAIPILD